MLSKCLALTDFTLRNAQLLPTPRASDGHPCAGPSLVFGTKIFNFFICGTNKKVQISANEVYR